MKFLNDKTSLLTINVESNNSNSNGKWSVFVLTFISYASSHFARKSYSNIKPYLIKEGLDPILMSSMDFYFMLFYSFGTIFVGHIHSHNTPIYIGLGMLGNGLALLLLLHGLISVDGIEPNLARISHYSKASQFYFISIMIFHGICQSTGGPLLTAVMGKFFVFRERGFVFGLWTAHQYVGNIAAALTIAAISTTSMSYHWSLILPIVINVIWGFVIFKGLHSKPEEIPIMRQPTPQNHRVEEKSISPSKETTPNNASVFREIIENDIVDEYIGLINIVKKVPSVLLVAFSLGFLKFISYALFFNLPLLLAEEFSFTKGTLVSLFFDVGMMIGGPIIGKITDVVDGKRSSVIICSSFLIIPLMSLLAMERHITALSSIIILLIIGILLGGGSNILSSAVCVDIADREVFSSSSTALPKITGLVNGIASLVASIGLAFIGTVNSSLGYKGVWLLLILSIVASIILLVPVVYVEITSEQQPIRRSPRRRQSYEAIPSRSITFTSRDYL